ncbi:hypothetical protein [Virgibacillus siamensis]|uniref:hypothetical protein n=1 Tax=Virgibacillus siamensis TaxID=480071 RepID=UPI0009875A70|nr:hypothetical protein [Virgibacillus siamensis]
MSERLKHIKEFVELAELPYEDIVWLIEQAERGEQLESENERLRNKNDELIGVVRDYTHRDKRAYRLYGEWIKEQDSETE